MRISLSPQGSPANSTRSGVVTIVKATYTTQITDYDFTCKLIFWLALPRDLGTNYYVEDSSADLAIWNMIEPASVIIAASLPNLRVFIVKNSANLKASLRIGSNSRLSSRGKSRRTHDIYLENVQSTSMYSIVSYSPS